MADTRKLQIVIDAKNQSQRAMRELQSDTSNVSKGFNKFHAFALAAAGGVVYLGKEMLRAAADFEQTKVAFETMLGSAELANTMLRDLSEFAASTPFELRDIEKNAKQLLAYGIEAQKIIPTLKMLGDVSAGLSVPIQQVARAYGQVKVAGRLMGQELLQFTNAGVPLIAELAKNLGVAESAIKDMVAEGKIGFKEVEEAFGTMSGEGGKFFDLMEKQSKTLLGRISNLKDNWDIFLREQGSALIVWAGYFVDKLALIVEWLRKDAQGINNVGKTIYELIQFFKLLGLSVIAVIKTFVGWIATMFDVSKVMHNFVKDVFTNFTKLGSHLKNIFTAIGKAFKGEWKEAGDFLKKNLHEAFANTNAELANFKVNHEATQVEIGDAWNKVTETWKDFTELRGFDNVVEKFGEFGDVVNTDIAGPLGDADKKGKEVADAFGKYSDKIRDFSDELAGAVGDSVSKITDLGKKLQEITREHFLGEREIASDVGQAVVEQEAKIADLQAQYNKETDSDKKQTLLKQLEREKEVYQERKDLLTTHESEIREARRRASLTEFERVLEDLQRKKIALDEEFYNKKTAIEKELKLELEKLDALKQINDASLKLQDKFLAQAEVATAESINREIEMYNELARAIAKAKSGATSSAVGITQSVRNRANQATPEINITVNGDVSGQELVEKVQNGIMQGLRMNTKLAL